MDSTNGKMGTVGGDQQDPLHFRSGLPWWARRYSGLSAEEKVALARAYEGGTIFGYSYYLEKELLTGIAVRR